MLILCRISPHNVSHDVAGSALGNIVIWNLLATPTTPSAQSPTTTAADTDVLLSPFSLLEGHETSIVALCEAQNQAQSVIVSVSESGSMAIWRSEDGECSLCANNLLTGYFAPRHAVVLSDRHTMVVAGLGSPRLVFVDLRRLEVIGLVNVYANEHSVRELKGLFACRDYLGADDDDALLVVHSDSVTRVSRRRATRPVSPINATTTMSSASTTTTSSTLRTRTPSGNFDLATIRVEQDAITVNWLEQATNLRKSAGRGVALLVLYVRSARHSFVVLLRSL